MSLIQGVKNQLGELSQVKWHHSKRRNRRYAVVTLAVDVTTLPCVCKNTNHVSVGDLSGMEALFAGAHVQQCKAVLVYKDTGLVRHQRCGQVLGNINN